MVMMMMIWQTWQIWRTIDMSFSSIDPLTLTKSMSPQLYIVEDEKEDFSLSPSLDSLGSTLFSLKDINEVKN